MLLSPSYLCFLSFLTLLCHSIHLIRQIFPRYCWYSDPIQRKVNWLWFIEIFDYNTIFGLPLQLQLYLNLCCSHCINHDIQTLWYHSLFRWSQFRDRCYEVFHIRNQSSIYQVCVFFFVNFTVFVFSRSSLCFIEIVYFEPQLLDGLAVQSINFIVTCGLHLIN